MYEIGELLIAAAVALCGGLAVGVFVGKQFSSDTQKQRDMQRQLERINQEQKEYQHEVAEHFTDTAKLLRNMAESYRDVHNHLASGADNLCRENASGPMLTRLPESMLGVVDSAPEEEETASPPLDYAPKRSPYETGMLNEEFGLEKPVEEDLPLPADLPPVLR